MKKEKIESLLQFIQSRNPFYTEAAIDSLRKVYEAMTDEEFDQYDRNFRAMAD